MFDQNTYIERRHRLQQAVGSGLLLFLGNEESPMNYSDNTYRFRQDSQFLYFFGLDRPHLAALIDIDAQEATVYGDELTVEDVVWMGPQPTIAEQARRVGIGQTAPYAQLEETLKEAASAGRAIHFLPPYRADNQIRLSQWLSLPIEEVRNKASEPLIKAVVALASVKDAGEIAEMEKAVNISGAMHLAAMRRARAGTIEAELAGIVEGIAIASGGQLAYPAILTVNGQTLHNHDHSNKLQKGQMVLGDFGAETGMHYAGDITRTFPVDKRFTNQQKEIYNIVLEAQIAAIEALKPGVEFLNIHLLAARKLADGLQALGLMQGDTEEAVQQGAHALFFPHGLGHMIGMDVHDMEGLGENYVGYGDELERSTQFGLKSLRLARSLKPGFVLTVEPGLYFIPELIKLWKEEKKFEAFINYNKVEAYLGFSGIRIEDNVLITEKGYHILGNPIPKTVEEVETERGGR